MSERKVLNKYYPPDYDPSIIPKLKLAKDRQYVIRVMAPFHMRCKTCGNYIYKGTKFNARKETVQTEDYLGLRIFRFYIKCTKCVAEITFKTDPENTDYSIEHGATRNFEAEKLLEKQEKAEEQQKEEDEGNPMKLLENRTRDSKREMERMENLEELMDLNKRQAKINYEGMLMKYQETEEQRQKREMEEDEEEMKKIFGTNKIRRLNDNDEEAESDRMLIKTDTNTPSNILLSESQEHSKHAKSSSIVPVRGMAKKKAQLLGIVKKKVESSSKVTNPPEEKSNEKVVVSKEKAVSSSSTVTAGGLGLLGAYGSEDSNSSEGE